MFFYMHITHRGIAPMSVLKHEGIMTTEETNADESKNREGLLTC